jgi:hypothetical protein
VKALMRALGRLYLAVFRRRRGPGPDDQPRENVYPLW